MDADLVIPPQHDGDIELRFRKTEAPPETVEQLEARGLRVTLAASGQLFALDGFNIFDGCTIVIPIQPNHIGFTGKETDHATTQS
jgi:hypothetical protein